MIFTYGSEPPSAPDGWNQNGASYRPGDWPVGGYGAGPVRVQHEGTGQACAPQEYARAFLACGRELAAMGQLDTPVRRQLFGVKLA